MLHTYNYPWIQLFSASILTIRDAPKAKPDIVLCEPLLVFETKTDPASSIQATTPSGSSPLPSCHTGGSGIHWPGIRFGALLLAPPPLAFFFLPDFEGYLQMRHFLMTVQDGKAECSLGRITGQPVWDHIHPFMGPRLPPTSWLLVAPSGERKTGIFLRVTVH